MSFTQIFLVTFISGALPAFFFSRTFSTAKVWIIIGIGVIAMIGSLLFIEPDKDGHFLLVATIPFLFAASLGAAVGCLVERVTAGKIQ